MDTPQNIPYGIIHGRFQPPHNGHIRYILAGLKETQHLYIGICTPDLCTQEEADKTGYPCTAELNPFTHKERIDMLTLALDEQHIPRERYSLIAFPSDYTHIEKLIPKNTVFLMSITSPSDTIKNRYIQSLGYQTKTIIELTTEEREEKAGIVREGLKNGTDKWESIVPASVAQYIKKNPKVIH